MRLASVLTPLNDDNLALAAQCGVEDVVVRYPGPQLDDLLRLQRLIESHGLRVGAVEGYLPMERLRFGVPGRERELEAMSALIRHMGRRRAGSLLSFHGQHRLGPNPPGRAGTGRGCLPPWRVEELPAPLPFSGRNALRTIGPGAILLVGAIGMGEWVAGPMFAVQYGRSILWIATVAFVLQSLLNLEAIRYTLYTGEPIITGFMRLRPGPRVWGPLYAVAAIAQLGLPAGAAAWAGVVFALHAGRASDSGDSGSITWITVALVLLAALFLASGKMVERMLERLAWAMIVVIFCILLWVNLAFVPLGDWGRTFTGFFQVGELPPDVDFVMLAVFAALAGAGGVGNLAIASWFRDKGFGMGSKAGNLGGVWSNEQTMTSTGAVFPISDESLHRWRGWWRYSLLDQSVLWAGGCIVGMFLMVNLATGIFTPGLKISGVAAGVFQAAEMRKLLGGLLAARLKPVHA
jgi:hypothetical protein